MPLIVITGLPCAGKSHRAQQINDAFTEHIANEPSQSKRTVQIVPSHHASLDTEASTHPSSATLRNQIYNSAAQEKTARAEEFSAIKRAVSKDNVVIADSLNYIKGYRYQLWCEAKAAGTRCCVIHVAAQEDECKQWNRERLRLWEKDSELLQEDEAAATDGSIQGTGRDVLGGLIPESHTAIYGDRAAVESRSRSSSLDAEDEETSTPFHRPAQNDTMTLKSLYISESTSAVPPVTQVSTTGKNSNSTGFPLPDTPLPLPSSSHPYGTSTLSSLAMRYEPPSPFSRWDTPLFTIPTSDAHPPYKEIWEAMYPPPAKPTSKKALSQLPRVQGNASGTNGPSDSSRQVDDVRQHQATILPHATSSSALQVLESTTLEVGKLLLSAARQQKVADGEGGAVQFSVPIHTPAAAPAVSSDTSLAEIDQKEHGGLDAEITLPVGTQLSQPSLQRLRRKYTQIQRGAIAHGREYVGMRDGRRGVIEGFVGFLQAELEQAE